MRYTRAGAALPSDDDDDGPAAATTAARGLPAIDHWQQSDTRTEPQGWRVRLEQPWKPTADAVITHSRLILL